MNKICYIYKKSNGEWIGTDYAEPNPKNQSEWLLPGNGTFVEPPSLSSGEAAVWSGGVWTTVPDFRDHTYYNKSTKEEVSLDLGEYVNSGITILKPYDSESVFDEIEGWVIPDEVKNTRKNAAISGYLINIESIRILKEESFRSTVNVHGIEWDSGKKYLRNLEVAIRNYSSQEPAFWLDASNTPHIPSGEAWLQSIADAIDLQTYQSGLLLYQAKWDKRDEINALTTENYQSYDIHSDWPW